MNATVQSNGKVPLRYLTIEQLGKEPGTDVWVLNNSKLEVNENVDRTRLSLHINDGYGDLIFVPVEASFVPQNLSEFIDKSTLISSSQFRTAIRRKLLLIIDPNSARSMLETKAGRIESARIQEIQNAGKAAVINDVRITDETPEQNDILQNPNNNKNPDQEINRQVHPAVLNIMNNSDDSDQIHASLMNQMALRIPDYRYVAQQAEVRKMDKLARWATRRIAKLSAHPN